MWFMRSPEALAQLHPSFGATYYCNTPHLLFSWLISTSILKGLQPRCYFDSFREQKKKNRRERKTITHLTSLSPKHRFTTQSPVSALTCICALTRISLEYHGVEVVMIYLSVLHLYRGCPLSFLKRRACCFSSQRLSQINAMS